MTGAKQTQNRSPGFDFLIGLSTETFASGNGKTSADGSGLVALHPDGRYTEAKRITGPEFCFERMGRGVLGQIN
jgi:hypothetical protein